MNPRSYGLIWLLPAWLAVAAPLPVLGGGSGLNVLVVANEVSTNSVDLANYYMEQRQVPPGHLLRISWSGGNVQWTRTEFEALLLNPLQAFLDADAQRADQIQYLVLSMDIPYRVVDGSSRNSITSSLFYGFKDGGGYDNSYAGSEERFAAAPPDTAPGRAWLTTMLTAESLDQAKATVDQGTASDGAFPAQTAWLAKTTDPLRNKRYKAFDNAIFNARLRPPYSLNRIESDTVTGVTNILGYQTGLANFSVSPNAFVPGSVADSFTSFGGKLFESPGQTTLLEFIHAGAAGSYGTVTEPLAQTAKYPEPQVYFYQARGFSLAECYYQSLAQPYQGLVVGEPLAAPFRTERFAGGWCVSGSNTVLQGVANLYGSFGSGGGDAPVESVDLFVDGLFHQTLATRPPGAGNLLTIRIGGYPLAYTVPTNATLSSIAAELADLLNQPEHADVTKVRAQAFGDRIELQSLRKPWPAGTFEFVDQPDDPSVPRVYQAMRAEPWGRARARSPGVNGDGRFQFSVSTPAEARYVIEASSNLVGWVPILTNALGGPMDFVEAEGASFPQRFYRAVPPTGLAAPAWITPLERHAGGPFRARVTAAKESRCIVQASSDGHRWTDVYTHEEGGPFEFVDPGSTNASIRFYRTRSADSNLYAEVSILGSTSSSGNILRVDHGLAGPYLVYASTNTAEWFPVYQATSPSGVRVEVGSDAGDAPQCTTHLSAASPEFLDSTAVGYRGFIVEPGWFQQLGPNSYLELEVTKTNGMVVSVSATNLPGNTTDAVLFVQQLAQAVDAEPDLGGDDGLVMADLVEGGFFADGADFNLQARAPGWGAAGIQVRLTGSSDLDIWELTATTPASHTGPVALEGNLSDLRPRNHLYVSAGLSSLVVDFDLDTTSLEDGHHELTAVAYGGNSVHAQTHAVLPVVIDNTPLAASISGPGSETSLAAAGGFSLSVTANTNQVDEIRLYGPGGLLDTRVDESTASFDLNGSYFGAGTHPFHAIVTAGGMTYRTETLHVTLIRD